MKELKSEIISQKEEMIKVVKEIVNKSKEDTAEKIEEQSKMIESLNEQYKKQTECMNQIQRDIQEMKNSIETCKNCLNESEDRLSDLKDKISASEQGRKYLLKITRNHKIKIQELISDAKKNNIRLIWINEKEGDNTKGIKRLFTEEIAENFPNMSLETDILFSEAYRTPNSHNQNKPPPRLTRNHHPTNPT